jgi:hypothetical protein
VKLFILLQRWEPGIFGEKWSSDFFYIKWGIDFWWFTKFGYHPKVAKFFSQPVKVEVIFEKFIFMKMEVVSLTDLFLNLCEVLGSHIQNLGSLITVDFSEWEIVTKSPVI